MLLRKRKKKHCTILFLVLIFFPITSSTYSYYFKPNSNPQVTDYSEEITVKISAGSWAPYISRAVGTNPGSLDAGDANNDGYTDIVVSHEYHDKISILTWNSGTNDWNPYIQRDTGGLPGKPVIARVNGDAYNDIIVPNYNDEEVSIYFGRSDHTWEAEFSKYVGPHPFSVAIGDANNDGYNDIAITHYALHSYISVYTWNGAGGWNYAEILNTEWNPAHVVIADVDNDGDNDILASHNDGSGGLSVLLWNGADWNDYFYINVPDYPSTIAVADVDDDGDKDIVCALVGLYSSYNKVAIMLWNSGTKTWDTTTKTVGYGPRVFIGDANSDGKNDIICSNYQDDTISILLWNSGTSDWKSQIVLPIGNGPSNPNIKDFNHDGKNDIAAANWNDHDVSLLYWFEDNTPPSITINNPIQDGNYSTAPTFDVDTTDNYYIDKKWYTLNINPTKHFFTSNEPISGWTSVPDGTVSITFYVNDTAGNENSDSVIVNKDNTAPIITILSPVIDDCFENIAPLYSVEIFDEHLDSMWYTYSYYDPTKYIFTDNGTLSGWTGLPDGNIPIRFYANDTFNNEIYQQVYVIKDTTAPDITIYDPVAYDYYGSNAPYYNIYIDEYTLDTFWYTLNESSNIFMTSNWDYINQTLWDSFPSSFIRITFYANDSFSRFSSETVTVIKDIDDPIIQINSPSTNELFGILGPGFDVSLIEPNLDEIWYSLDNGINNYTLDTWCNYYAWDRCDDGDVTINFYARDMMGNKGFAEIVVRRDSTTPTITINSPIEGQEFSSTPPNFNLSVSELNPDSTWYSFDNGVNCYLCGLIGQIDSSLWNNLDNGEYTIKFYANDTVGNEESTTVKISKNEPTDDFLLVIAISAISGGAIIGLASIVWLRKRRK